LFLQEHNPQVCFKFCVWKQTVQTQDNRSPKFETFHCAVQCVQVQ